MKDSHHTTYSENTIKTHNIYLTFKYNLHDGSTKEQSYYKEKRKHNF